MQLYHSLYRKSAAGTCIPSTLDVPGEDKVTPYQAEETLGSEGQPLISLNCGHICCVPVKRFPQIIMCLQV